MFNKILHTVLIIFLVGFVFFLFCCANPNMGLFVDSRDGKTYKTVKIGNQTWMAENLNYKTEDGSHCFQCKKYGRLYEWHAALSACPEGWHLPTKDEWKNFLSGRNARYLKSGDEWYNDNSYDRYDFSILPAGLYDDGQLNNRGSFAQFWSADVNEGPYFVPRENTQWSEVDIGCGAAISVRCVQGEDVGYARKLVRKISERCSETKKAAKEKLGKVEGTLVDSRDGKKYKTIKIGDQEWMAEDLKYEVAGASSLRTVKDFEIENVYDKRDWDRVIIFWLKEYLKNVTENAELSRLLDEYENIPYSAKRNLHYNLIHIIQDDSKLLDYIMKEKKYGACIEKDGHCGLFYEFIAAKAACPEGWRLPEYDEWETLKNNISIDDALPRKKSEKMIRNYFSIDENSVYWSSTPWNNQFEEYYVSSFSKEIIPDTLNRVGTTARVRCIRRNDADYDMNEAVAIEVEYFNNKDDGMFETGTLKDSRDGKIYKTVKIGNQNWMSENLRYAGKSRYFVNGIHTWCYAHDDELCNKLGSMYSSRSYTDNFLSETGAACPNGWHIPSTEEWSELAEFISSQNTTVLEGLSVLLGGMMVNGAYEGLGEYTAFATDVERDKYIVKIYHNSIEMFVTDYLSERYNVYIRCVENVKNGSFKDPRDGTVYKTVKYGKTTWMAENLKYKSPNSFCFDDKKANCDKLGRLYTHSAATKACPTGWKLPSKEDFNSLPQNGDYSYMRLLARDEWNTQNESITQSCKNRFTSDAYSFSLLPAGRRDIDGRYLNGPNYVGLDPVYLIELPSAGLWTSSLDSRNTHDDDYYFFVNEKIEIESGSEFLGLSVRCVKK